jgi:hypothetical protein
MKIRSRLGTSADGHVTTPDEVVTDVEIAYEVV